MVMRIQLIVCMVLGLICGACDAHWNSNDLLSEFRQQAPRGWARLEEIDSNGMQRFSLTETSSGRTLRKADVLIARRNGWVACTEFRQLGSHTSRSKEVVRAFNDQYGFWLRQAENNPSSWVLQTVQSGPEGVMATKLELAKKYFFALTPAYGLDPDLLFREAMNVPTIQWTKAEPVVLSNRQCVRVSYTRTRFFEQVADPVEYQGYVIFDPGNSWARVEQSTTTLRMVRGIARRTLVRIEYSDVARNGVRPLREYNCSARWDDDGSMDDSDSSYQIRCVWSETNGSPPAPEKFYMSGYGLPEPIGTQLSAQSRTWLWLLLGAIAMAGVAILCAHRIRTKQLA